MKILHLVEFYYPSVGGSQECVRQISERLSKSGHDVTVATSHIPQSKDEAVRHGVRIKRFKISGNLVRGIIGDKNKFKEFVLNGNFDVIMCYAAQQWTFDLLNEIIEEVKAKKILVPCGFSGLHEKSYSDYFIKMPNWLKKYDALVLLSNTYQDAQFIKQHKIKKYVLIPNCADENEFSKLLTHSNIRDVKKQFNLNNTVICTIGGFTGLKGQLETMAVFKRLPLRDVSLVIIGNNDFDNKYFESCRIFAESINNKQKNYGKNVVILETNNDVDRTNTLDILKSSDLFLFMSYIEASPLVIFEAMAAGVPFVCNDVGNVKEIINWTKAGWLIHGKNKSRLFDANKTEALIKTFRLLKSKRQRDKMTLNGRRAFKNTYNWHNCAKMYEELYEELFTYDRC